MERKIGKIFKYKNEWYQCVECDNCGKCLLFDTECGSGTKSDLADEIFGECSKARRTDNKHAILKRLNDDDSIGIEFKRTKILTVQDLIDELTKIKDKSKKVILQNPYSDKDYFEIDEVEDFDEDVTIWYK